MDHASGGSGGSGGSWEARGSSAAAGRVEDAKDRNREHARNTRLRKKQYVEDLQAALGELTAEFER